MSLNDTVSAERLHIGFFGLRNAGKSSLVNAVTGQALSLVSDVKGTTTDPVQKAMELLPLGPVVILDTPGLDDEGALGEMRVERARRMLAKTDIAILVADASQGLTALDEELLAQLRQRKLPHLIAYNKSDLLETLPKHPENTLYVSAKTGFGIQELKEAIAAFGRGLKKEKLLCSDLFSPGDVVLLVTPIDESAPKGRLILPQQLTIRDVLDHHGIPMLCQVEEIPAALSRLATPPALVITDSQAFKKVAQLVPEAIPLTSFSILMARYKGELSTLVQGAKVLSTLQDGDKVLICEGCTHHRQCGDIGTVKLPGWIRKHCGWSPEFSFTSGGEFPQDVGQYRLVVHCGGCMLNDKEMAHRTALCQSAGVPMVNYGAAIAAIHGILPRALAPLNISL